MIEEVIRLTEAWFRGLAYSFTDPKALFWWPTVVVSLAGVALHAALSRAPGPSLIERFADYRAKHKEFPSVYSEYGYVAARCFHEAIQRVDGNTQDKDKLRAAMLAVTSEKDGLDPAGPYGEFSCRVRCAVDLYGPADLAGHHDVTMLGKKAAEAPELYRAASPVTYVDKNDPPILILHGTADKTVNIGQSKLFAAKLKEAGARHELVIVEGAPHTFHLQPNQRDLRPVVLGFFDQHLKATR